MRGIVRSAGVVLVLLLAFVLQQTGAARSGADPCSVAGEAHEDEARGCAEQGEEHCPPSCADCSGCPGPARGLVAETSLVHVIPLVATLPPSWVAPPAGVEPVVRLDRPPRA
ncbi:MAG TPA: hypothetical protein VG755_42865 [Nannocystaceae bacterium]|nr:hypothetical protein [Nannocystaceae bacterium]